MKFLGLTLAGLLVVAGLAVLGSPKAVSAADDDGAPRISLIDAKTAFDDKGAVFIDARSETAFKEERIAGAVNINAGNFEAKYSELPKDRKLIVYCS
jgi:hypothetical protein